MDNFAAQHGAWQLEAKLLEISATSLIGLERKKWRWWSEGSGWAKRKRLDKKVLSGAELSKLSKEGFIQREQTRTSITKGVLFGGLLLQKDTKKHPFWWCWKNILLPICVWKVLWTEKGSRNSWPASSARTNGWWCDQSKVLRDGYVTCLLVSSSKFSKMFRWFLIDFISQTLCPSTAQHDQLQPLESHSPIPQGLLTLLKLVASFRPCRRAKHHLGGFHWIHRISSESNSAAKCMHAQFLRASSRMRRPLGSSSGLLLCRAQESWKVC